MLLGIQIDEQILQPLLLLTLVSEVSTVWRAELFIIRVLAASSFSMHWKLTLTWPLSCMIVRVEC